MSPPKPLKTLTKKQAKANAKAPIEKKFYFRCSEDDGACLIFNFNAKIDGDSGSKNGSYSYTFAETEIKGKLWYFVFFGYNSCIDSLESLEFCWEPICVPCTLDSLESKIQWLYGYITENMGFNLDKKSLHKTKVQYILSKITSKSVISPMEEVFIEKLATFIDEYAPPSLLNGQFR